MGRLVFFATCSVDGFTADIAGGFGWAAPDAEVHAFVNDLEREVETALYGRRMYEVMAYWETGGGPDAPEVERDYAQVWRRTGKIVYSRSLAEVTTARTELHRELDARHVRALVARSDGDVTVGGPTLARAAFDAGLVDEVRLLIAPVLVGGGLRALPDTARMQLSLVEQRRSAGSTVYLRYVRR